jgi:hypothetical protein
LSDGGTHWFCKADKHPEMNTLQKNVSMELKGKCEAVDCLKLVEEESGSYEPTFNVPGDNKKYMCKAKIDSSKNENISKPCSYYQNDPTLLPANTITNKDAYPPMCKDNNNDWTGQICHDNLSCLLIDGKNICSRGYDIVDEYGKICKDLKENITGPVSCKPSTRDRPNYISHNDTSGNSISGKDACMAQLKSQACPGNGPKNDKEYFVRAGEDKNKLYCYRKPPGIGSDGQCGVQNKNSAGQPTGFNTRSTDGGWLGQGDHHYWCNDSVLVPEGNRFCICPACTTPGAGWGAYPGSASIATKSGPFGSVSDKEWSWWECKDSKGCQMSNDNPGGNNVNVRYNVQGSLEDGQMQYCALPPSTTAIGFPS